MMMQSGFETSDPEAEGAVSMEVVKMRLALDYPVIPDSVSGIYVYFLYLCLVGWSALFVWKIDFVTLLEIIC
jgi:hypothetical protein